MDDRTANLARLLIDGLRRLTVVAARSCAVLGASFWGDADLLAAIRNDGASGPRPLRGAPADAHEVARGIVEIEAFLASRPYGSAPDDSSAL